MVESTGHCPYLGLKQNQAIRFASPTPEHRCYAAGQAQEIPLVQPDYQTAFCLSSDHIKCPLYTGSGLPSTSVPGHSLTVAHAGATSVGVRAWLNDLPARERMIYAFLVTALVIVVAFYAFASVGLIWGNVTPGSDPSPALPPASATVAIEATATPTLTPTLTPTPSPTLTATPTRTPLPSATPTEILPTIESVTVTPAPTIYVPPVIVPPIIVPTPTFLPEPTSPPDLEPIPTEEVPGWPEEPTAPPEAPTIPPEAPTIPPEAPTIPPEAPTALVP